MAGRIKRRQAAEAGLGSPTASTWLSGFDPGSERQNRRQGLRQAGRQAERQATRQETRTPNLSDAGFGSGMSLSGVNDFDTWAAGMRDPQYREARDEWLNLDPGWQEQLARDYTPEMVRGPNGQPNVQASLEQRGLWNPAPEQPSVDIFSGQGGQPAGAPQPAGSFQPPAASAINYGGFGSGAMQPSSFTPPRNIEGGTVGPRPPQGNFTAGRRRQKRGRRSGAGSGNGYSIGMVPGGR